MEERGVNVDHATLNRWVIDYSPLIAAEAKKRKRSVASSWRMDETHVKVKGQWVYLLKFPSFYTKPITLAMWDRNLMQGLRNL